MRSVCPSHARLRCIAGGGGAVGESAAAAGQVIIASRSVRHCASPACVASTSSVYRRVASCARNIPSIPRQLSTAITAMIVSATSTSIKVKPRDFFKLNIGPALD